MSNKSVGAIFVGSTDESNINYLPISSSAQRRFVNVLGKGENIFTDDFQLRSRSTEVERLSPQTNNFFSKKDMISFGTKTLDNIAQASAKKRKEIVEQYVNEIRVLIRQDDFADGRISQSERYMVDVYEQGNIDYLADAIMIVYESSLADVHILVGILTMISCVPYDAISPKGQIMAMGLLTNKSLSVRDKAIQCFEKWNSKKGLGYLKSIDCSPNWLQKYVEKVIMYIERDGIE